MKSMNDRVEFDGQIKANRAAAAPYVAPRDFYLKRRKAGIDALHSSEYRAQGHHMRRSDARPYASGTDHLLF
ncbi:ABC-type transporter lipoprotein component MlaA [Novosphingobium gossypii]